MVDSDNAVTKTVYVNGFKGVLFEYTDEPGLYSLTWQDESYKYLLNGVFASADEIVRVAERVLIEDEQPPTKIEKKAIVMGQEIPQSTVEGEEKAESLPLSSQSKEKMPKDKGLVPNTSYK